MKNSEFPFKGDFSRACLANIQFKPEITEIIYNWTQVPRDMMLLLGEPGTGKTYFCAALYHQFTERRKHVQILNEMDFLNGLKESINKGWGESYEIEKLGEREILILDDMGSGKLNEWHLDMLFQLIDKRSETRLPTIITSNLFLSDIKAKCHARLFSRLSASRNCIIELRQATDLRQVYK